MTRIHHFFIFSLVLALSGCASFGTHTGHTGSVSDSDIHSGERLANDLPPVGKIAFTEDALQEEPDPADPLNTIDPQLADIITGERNSTADELETPRAQDSLPPREVPQAENRQAAQPYTNLLDRIRDGFKLDLSQTNPKIEKQAKWYAKHVKYLNRTLRRSEKYLYHIVEEVERRNLPMELALLPVVESAFDPFAYSHGRASGLWQFIPGTGRMYGLTQDWWYDGRRDVVASTEAALRYLEKLSNTFGGDWLLALASYNAGSGMTSRAIRKNRKRNRPTDFWSLKLPRETSIYVPKLIAVAKLVNEPHKYGITLPHIANRQYFDVVDTGSQFDLAQAARLAEISIEELYRLNPGFNRWATRPKGPHKLVIPVEKVEVFKEHLARLPKDRRLVWQHYKIKKGDSLIRIANKHRTTPAVIKQINKLRSSRIRAGDTILIPVASASLSEYDLSAATRFIKKQQQVNKQTNRTRIVHTVKRGDNFWDISRKYGVNHRKLARWNGMAPGDVLRPGKKLTIWKTKRKYSTNHLAKNQKGRALIRKINYRVRSGDSLSRIAGKFKTRVKDIARWNSLNPKRYLQPGQKLTLFVDTTSVH
ncbi:MAG: lytic transglycosylase [Proteobacteria bacterium]|nr:MAG: lytic transglycosylase [Pseudomonadota bacterium]